MVIDPPLFTSLKIIKIIGNNTKHLLCLLCNRPGDKQFTCFVYFEL